MTEKERVIDRERRFKEAKNLKKRLSALIKSSDKKITLCSFSIKHGMDPAAVSRVLSGIRTPRQQTIDKIDSALKAENT